jgi:hypothetical protein
MMVNTYLGGGGRAPFEPGTRFAVLDRENPDNPLLENKIKLTIRALLERQGYQAAPLEQAEFGLEVRYGSGRDRVIKRTYEPDYGWPGYYHGFYPGYYWPYSPWGWGTGWNAVTYTEVQYTHDLQVFVFDGERYRSDGTREMIWVGECMSRSPSPDLRTALAYMLTALFDHFGEDTGKGVEVEIRMDDPRVLLLR